MQDLNWNLNDLTLNATNTSFVIWTANLNNSSLSWILQDISFNIADIQE